MNIPPDFAAVVRTKKDLEKNKNIIDFVNMVLDTPETLDTEELFLEESTYGSFVALFGSCLVPTVKFKKMVCDKPAEFETTFTAEDEALAIAILENNASKWSAEVNKILQNNPMNPDAVKAMSLSDEERKVIPPSKFTMGTNETSNNLRSGWNDKGKLRFFMLLKTCKEFRQNEGEYKEFKEDAVSQLQMKYKTKSRKRPRTTNADIENNFDNEENESAKNLKQYYAEQFNHFAPANTTTV